jgi:hypothetical protein
MATAVTTPPTMTSLGDPRIKQKLQALRQTDNVTNLLYVLRTYAYLAVVIAATLWFYTINDWSFWLNVPVTIVAIILIGAGQHQLTGLAHESSVLQRSGPRSRRLAIADEWALAQLSRRERNVRANAVQAAMAAEPVPLHAHSRRL